MTEVYDTIINRFDDGSTSLYLMSGDDGIYLRYLWLDSEGFTRSIIMHPTMTQLYQLAKFITQYDY